MVIGYLIKVNDLWKGLYSESCGFTGFKYIICTIVDVRGNILKPPHGTSEIATMPISGNSIIFIFVGDVKHKPWDFISFNIFNFYL